MSVTKDTSKSINFGLLSIVIVLAAVVIWIGVRVLLPEVPTVFAGSQPDTLRVTNGQLHPCPSTPNCVNSQSTDVDHSIQPLTYEGNSQAAIAQLKDIITQQERTEIISETDNYLYAQFTSHWMGFIDDVEFYVNENQGVIDVRSASRLGESDLGVNRERIETIRQEFQSN
ncbi:DUF1499 domain-containing protein [Crocosphaera chwakensis]|uniref:DUF1499 domain-containing protein n=1 Tax=Crocosphaera chwakensis CCY0110 TaxID=391612 RepID=A3IQP5_9CHRO|nr:DUF1499 domain-containing protein [Crocosphaera chwakensis]EAZ91100.1 hypothetical protein CY0110_12572 [Crocosphaera chwakensis CCY0110]